MEGGAVVARPQVEETRACVELLACVPVAGLARPRLLVDGAVGAVAGAGLQAGSPHLRPHTAQCVGQQGQLLGLAVVLAQQIQPPQVVVGLIWFGGQQTALK